MFWTNTRNVRISFHNHLQRLKHVEQHLVWFKIKEQLQRQIFFQQKTKKWNTLDAPCDCVPVRKSKTGQGMVWVFAAFGNTHSCVSYKWTEFEGTRQAFKRCCLGKVTSCKTKKQTCVFVHCQQTSAMVTRKLQGIAHRRRAESLKEIVPWPTRCNRDVPQGLSQRFLVSDYQSATSGFLRFVLYKMFSPYECLSCALEAVSAGRHRIQGRKWHFLMWTSCARAHAAKSHKSKSQG